MSHEFIAARIGVTTEDFGILLTGQRPLSAVEIALLGDVLGVGDYWLITGRQDPYRIVHAGRPPASDMGPCDMW